MFLYALTIVISAFLLFQVQPMIAKIILPWFGGSAAVWTICLLFFQVALLLGYLYAHALVRYLRPRAQAAVHIALLAVCILTLPIIPAASWRPAGNEDPTLRILGLLSAAVGLPYFLLSTTGPLLQAWYAQRFKGRLPYRLYALSNAGSMFALLSYPVLFEPVFTTHQQAMGWSVAFVVFALVCGLVAVRQRGMLEVPPAEDGPPPDAKLYLLWILLPACASTLLLAVTNHLTQNVAAIPFLWVLPLSTYLLTFILAFEREGWYRRNPFLQLMAVSLGGMAYVLSDSFENAGVKLLVPLFVAGLFFCCMVCHGELARLKPHPRYLTAYYLMISLGGALGGVFVGLVAPQFFRGYFELHIGLAASAVLVLVVVFERWRDARWLVGASLTLALLVYVSLQIRESVEGNRVMVRNFYGGLRVRDSGSPDAPDSVRKLLHGTINHGEQFLNPRKRKMATTYYAPNTGVGLTIQAEEERGPLRVGVIGLGTGTLAAYGRRGDYYRFYEINPLVIRIAQTEFTFLGDSGARVDVALGDARLSLERETPENFDVLAVDAFSGDSIPVHLLTREAFQLYFHHLRPAGVLAVHVSNKYLALQPVVRGIAESLGKMSMLVDTEDEEESDAFGAEWVLVSDSRDFFEHAGIQKTATKVEANNRLRLWTDDYSNLFRILK